MTPLLQALQARAGEFIGLRRDIHRHPELAFGEHRTAALVADKLEGWGYSVRRGIGGTGVVGTLVRGTGPGRLGIRADMDALPIHEASGADWSSVHAGVMHACGHDGHTAMLLAAARHLAEQGSFDGTLHLIFQPAEEGGGGALRMMDDGLFERFPCDAVFAMHNMPGIAQGHFVLARGCGDGLVGLRHGHGHRHWRPRCHAAPCGRPDRRRGQHRHGAADHRVAQHRPAAGGGGHRGCAARRPGEQRDPGQRRRWN